MHAALTTLSIAVAIGFAASNAVGHGGDQVAAAPSEAKKADKSKKLCRAIVTSGTRFSQRQCRSQEDWDKDAEQAQRYLEDGQMNGYRRDGEMNGQGLIGGPR